MPVHDKDKEQSALPSQRMRETRTGNVCVCVGGLFDDLHEMTPSVKASLEIVLLFAFQRCMKFSFSVWLLVLHVLFVNLDIKNR